MYCIPDAYAAHMSRRSTSVRIDLESPVAVYRQIADGLRATLVEGELRPGGALPSVRRLAIEFGITFNTVAQAYRQLAGEGWLDLRHGRRVIVLERESSGTAIRGQIESFRQRLRELVAQARTDGAAGPDLSQELRNLAERLEKR